MSEVEDIRRIYREYGDATRWSPSNVGNRLIAEEQAQELTKALQGYWGLPLPSRFSVLDIGCGGGANLRLLRRLGANPRRLFGVDLLPARITTSRTALPEANFLEANGACLPFTSKSFDLIILSTVFSSIKEAKMLQEIVDEIVRTLKPGGGILWYDIRYPSYNHHVHAVTRKQLRKYFRGFKLQLRSLTVLPPLARRLPALYSLFNRIPLFHSHWFGLIVDSSEGGDSTRPPTIRLEAVNRNA